MAQLRPLQVRTPSGSTIGVHEAGSGDRAIFAIGGMSVRSFAESAIRLVLEDATAR